MQCKELNNIEHTRCHTNNKRIPANLLEENGKAVDKVVPGCERVGSEMRCPPLQGVVSQIQIKVTKEGSGKSVSRTLRSLCAICKEFNC